MRILLADDDRSLRRVLQFKLEKQGHDVVAVEDGERALTHLAKQHFDIVVSDIRMPNLDGIELLQHVGEHQPDLKVILITAHATVAQAVEAVKLGAFDYITKPFDDDELFAVIHKATAFRELEKENRQLKRRLQEAEQPGRLIGVSPPIKAMMALIDKIAATDATVLLTGASGTGKEVVAKQIHARSHRSEGPFIAVNCGAIPRDLVESELFGHVKGSFTGAVRDKKGKFELADGGTLLLDEVGELAVDLQVKLLRVLQERITEPVGAEKPREVDVRVIAATNRDLRVKAAQGEFRQDLFYRLNVIPIEVPSLAERIGDIPLLVQEFIRRFGGGHDVKVSSELMDRLCAYNWPGNVRELENLVERMMILRHGNQLSLGDLPDDFGNEDKEPEPAKAVAGATPTYREVEEQLIRTALAKTGWNRARAARDLNIPRHVLLYRMKKYSITPPTPEH